MGLGAPLLIAAVAIPLLLRNVGAEKFGLIGLAWGMIGYASMLDLGMSRALTHKLASLRGTAQETQAGRILDSAIILTLAISMAFLAAMMALSLYGVDRLLTVSATSAAELRWATLLVAFALPLQALGMAYKGVNEAYANFSGITVVRILLGVTNFAGPMLVSFWSDRLDLLVATLTLARLVAFCAYFVLAKKCLGLQIWHWHGVSKAFFKDLMGFGRWVAISSVISPVLVQADRFLIASLISAAAVTSYVVPYEMTAQSMVLSGAVTTVFFPAVATLARTDRAASLNALKQWSLVMGAIMIAAMGTLALLMPWLLALWVGHHVGAESVAVGRILCLGVTLNSTGAMFYAYLHGIGRAKETAINHMIELPIHLVLLTMLITQFGVVGAATAWTLRVALDTTLLAWQVFGGRQWS